MGNQILCCRQKWSQLVDSDEKPWLDDNLTTYEYRNLAAACDIRPVESPETYKYQYTRLKSNERASNTSWSVHQATPLATQHISEREPENFDIDPSINAFKSTIFTSNLNNGNSTPVLELPELLSSTYNPSSVRKRWSSCGTVYIGSGCLFYPDREATLQSISVAITLLLRSLKKHPDIEAISEDYRSSQHFGTDNSNHWKIYDDIYALFDERKYVMMHPSSSARELLNQGNSEAKEIYEFIKILFRTTLFGPECAIVALILLERLVIAAEVDIFPWSWRRQVLACVLVASKVLDDQAVWNVDYCNILRGTSVDDLNTLERHLLALLQFNIDVPPSVYARYFFDLLALGELVGLSSQSDARRRLTSELAQQFQLIPQYSLDKVPAATNDKGLEHVTCGVFDLSCTPQHPVRRNSMPELRLLSKSHLPSGKMIPLLPDKTSNSTVHCTPNAKKAMPTACHVSTSGCSNTTTISAVIHDKANLPGDWKSPSRLPNYRDDSDISCDPLIVDEETVLINSSQANSLPFPNIPDSCSPTVIPKTENPHYLFYRNCYKPDNFPVVTAPYTVDAEYHCVRSSNRAPATSPAETYAPVASPMSQVIRAVMGGGRTVTYSLLRDAGLF